MNDDKDIMHDEDMGSSDDSDISSEDSDFNDIDIDESDMNLIMELDSQLDQNPKLYDAHIQFIQVLRTCKMTERLREARISMKDHFPLSETLWLDWITDELQALSEGNDPTRVLSLLQESHKDYFSIPLWMKHIEYDDHDSLIHSCHYMHDKHPTLITKNQHHAEPYNLLPTAALYHHCHQICFPSMRKHLISLDSIQPKALNYGTPISLTCNISPQKTTTQRRRHKSRFAVHFIEDSLFRMQSQIQQ